MFKYDHHTIKDQTDKRCNAYVREPNQPRCALLDGSMEKWKDGRMEGWKNGIITAGGERVDTMFKYDHHMVKDQTDKRCNVREPN